MTPTKWRRPRTGDQLLRVKFRNERVSLHAYRANQLRWTNTGDAWDIVEVEKAQ